MDKKLKKILLIDNSVAITGALKSSCQEAMVMRELADFQFVLPTNSTAIDYVRSCNFKVHSIPLLEIKKHLPSLIFYPIRLLQNSFRLKRLVRLEDVDVVIMNDYYNLIGVLLKLQLAPIQLVTFVRLLPNAMPGPLNRIWVRLALKYADQVVAVSDAVKRQLPLHQKVVRIYNALWFTENYAPFEVSNNEEVRLLYLSNYIPGKGYNLALEAFATAYQQDPRLRLDCFGGDMGLPKNRRYKEQIEQIVKEKGLQEVVRFHGFIDDIESVFKQADIYLNFSESESFSMTCAEAAFYGVPTIASRCGGPEEIIVDGETGMLLPNKDVEAFVKAILKLAGNIALRRKFSQQCRSYIRSKFDKKDFVNKMEQVLQLPKAITQVDVP